MEGEFNQKKRAERLSSSGLSYGHPHAIQEGSSGSANSHRDDSSVESKWISDPSCSRRSRPGIPLSFQEMDEIEGNFGDSDPRSRPTRQSCHVPGASMIADLGTKALSSAKLNQLKRMLGMSSPPSMESEHQPEVEVTSQVSGVNQSRAKRLVQILSLMVKMAIRMTHWMTQERMVIRRIGSRWSSTLCWS